MEGRDVRPWDGAKKRRGSHILGSPLRPFRGSEESTTPICGGQETPAQTGVLLPCAPAWDMCPLVRQGLQLRGERAVQKRTAAGCVDKAWRGWSVLRPQLGVLAEAPGPPQKSSTIVKWHTKGAPFSTASLCLCGLQESTPQSLPGRLNKCKSVHTGRVPTRPYCVRQGTIFMMPGQTVTERNITESLCCATDI